MSYPQLDLLQAGEAVQPAEFWEEGGTVRREWVEWLYNKL